jgi:hypothetical protein
LSSDCTDSETENQKGNTDGETQIEAQPSDSEGEDDEEPLVFMNRYTIDIIA